MNKKCLKKIIKLCETPENYCFEYIDGASVESDLRRMREYVRCVNKVEREYIKKYEQPTRN